LTGGGFIDKYLLSREEKIKNKLAITILFMLLYVNLKAQKSKVTGRSGAKQGLL
jgi:hypothetical protein